MGVKSDFLLRKTTNYHLGSTSALPPLPRLHTISLDNRPLVTVPLSIHNILDKFPTETGVRRPHLAKDTASETSR
jgi:hypothetical protein